MIDIDKIESLLDRQAIVYANEYCGHFRLTLKESGKDAKLKKLFIGGVPEKSVLIKCDGAKPLNALLSKELGQRCRCDYIMLTEIGGRDVLVFCELKSTSVKPAEITTQFKGGKCIVRYLEAILREFHNKDNLFPPHTEWFYVLFYKDSTRKRTTTRTKLKSGKSEKKFCWYPNPVIVDIKDIVG